MLATSISSLEPLFLPVAQAASSGPDIGLIAWTDVGQNIDLNQARKLFTTIYSETVEIKYLHKLTESKTEKSKVTEKDGRITESETSETKTIEHK